MVDNATSLTGNGLRDWLVQRVTAVTMLLYVIVLVVFFILHPHPSASVWHALFANSWMRILSIMFFLSLILHAWVGLWTISTDYLKCYCLRLMVQVGFIMGLLACFIWAVRILWGV